MRNRMVKITSGPHKDAVGYLSFDEKAEGVLNCRIDGVWLEFPETEFEFEPFVIGQNRGIQNDC